MDSNYPPASTRRRIAFVQALSFLLVALMVLAGCSTLCGEQRREQEREQVRVSRSSSAASRVSSRATDAPRNGGSLEGRHRPWNDQHDSRYDQIR